MRPDTHQLSDRQRTVNKRRSIVIAAILVPCCVLRTCGARATTGITTQTKTSDLAMQNLSRVAASAAEVKSVLLKDSGLMVELKRWVAKDATDHGQIVSDSDLTDDAMFERLESDVPFRAVATLLGSTIWLSSSKSESGV